MGMDLHDAVLRDDGYPALGVPVYRVAPLGPYMGEADRFQRGRPCLVAFYRVLVTFGYHVLVTFGYCVPVTFGPAWPKAGCSG